MRPHSGHIIAFTVPAFGTARVNQLAEASAAAYAASTWSAPWPLEPGMVASSSLIGCISFWQSGQVFLCSATAHILYDLPMCRLLSDMPCFGAVGRKRSLACWNRSLLNETAAMGIRRGFRLCRPHCSPLFQPRTRGFCAVRRGLAPFLSGSGCEARRVVGEWRKLRAVGAPGEVLLVGGPVGGAESGS